MAVQSKADEIGGNLDHLAFPNMFDELFRFYISSAAQLPGTVGYLFATSTVSLETSLFPVTVSLKLAPNNPCYSEGQR